MSLLQADPMNLECVPVLDVIFAEATGVRSISSEIGSFNRKGQGYFGENMKLRRQHSDCQGNCILTDMSHTTGTDVGLPPLQTEEEDIISPPQSCGGSCGASPGPSCAPEKPGATLAFPKESSQGNLVTKTQNHSLVRSLVGQNFTWRPPPKLCPSSAPPHCPHPASSQAL